MQSAAALAASRVEHHDEASLGPHDARDGWVACAGGVGGDVGGDVGKISVQLAISGIHKVRGVVGYGVEVGAACGCGQQRGLCWQASYVGNAILEGSSVAQRVDIACVTHFCGMPAGCPLCW